MSQRRFERIIRDRRLTPEEAARDEEIRRKVQEEFPPATPSSQTGSHLLSNAIRKAIRESGKSVYQIAKEADVSQIVVSRFLSGERDIRMATADRLAEVLGLAISTHT